ncbi:MAG: capsule assembly Wzi family protein [Gemmatimonadota bacterium]|nr:capsule assembly Wzi family protein [Gemmatimonadota bacterium]
MGAAPCGAQDTLSSSVSPLVTLGSSLEDRARTDQLRGERPTDGYLLRSPSTLTPRLREGGGGARWALIAPELSMMWNSALPYSQNDGRLWAGKGLNTSLLAGVRAEYGPVFLILAPQVGYMENRAFAELLPEPLQDRFTVAWYNGEYEGYTADLPLRFGDRALHFVDPGQSTLGVRAKGATLGVSTENQWWGPGIRNAIVMSNQAAGIPHLFVRTGPPLRTRLGSFEAKWILGALGESSFFDTLAANDRRALSAMVATFRPAGEPGLTLGIARSVQSPVSGAGATLGHALDVLTRWPRPDSAHNGSDQILSLFGRWVFPADGLEVYAERARQEMPAGLGDFLDYPNHTQGYTLGAQWARPVAEERLLRFQTEVTYLEQSSTFLHRPVPRYYTGASVPQGYTHRGQVIGAAIGPGASSQWLAADYLASAWQIGIFGGRIRWDNDAFYTTPRSRPGPWGGAWQAHDVSVLGGIRAGYDLPMFRIDAELSTGTRMNYLYQNFGGGWHDADRGVNVRNHTLRLGITPFRSRTP